MGIIAIQGKKTRFNVHILCCGISFYYYLLYYYIVFFTDSIYNQLRAQLARKKPTVDHLHRHQQQRGTGYGWFLDTIIGALAEGKKQVLRTFKQEDKRR